MASTTIRSGTISPRMLALIPITVAINVAVGRIVAELSLPLYLDTTGTILAAVLAGPAAGVATGLLTQILTSLIGGYVWLAFAPIQIVIALLAVVGARHGAFRTMPRSLWLGALVGLIGGTMSAVISYFVFQGVTAGGVTALTTLLNGLGLGLGWAVAVSSILTDVLDKAIAFALVGVALRGMPARMAARFPEAARSRSP